MKKSWIVWSSLFASTLAFAAIVVNPDGTWKCDNQCSISFVGGGKIKVCEKGGMTCITIEPNGPKLIEQPQTPK
ncbi:hypothetical protein [Oligoflexus tunisiensis]|uniref:hypothetical protein n=1 Tax=Oligoflexus tunisiensis TaxID=708132 RepID=UPI00114CFF23|nr:hypothetical protein [Oligoflexus tunisiensis]